MAEKIKSPFIEVDGKKYERLPIKTKVVYEEDNIIEVVKEFATEQLQENDILFISEKCVAITQGRSFPLKSIKPRKMATFLSHYVTKTPAGIGLGMPETMEMAIRECGLLRILIAATVSFITKLFGRKGDFYRIAGEKASSIDGPTPNTLPPYNTYVVLGPAEPDKTSAKIAEAMGVKVCIVDINDLGGKILGISHSDMNRDQLVAVLRDNPLGQCSEQTPMGIIREVE